MMQMQSREKQQPFFKPLSSGDSAVNNNIFEMRQKSHQNAANFQMNRIRENEVSQQKTEQNGSERLSSLHAKLHQEADKIRKWKVQTEIEMKQKEKKIHEANLTVETLRKSVLDLQLQNESLSLKLQSEIANREEIFQRISATRDMCNLLKSHSAKTEETLVKCEAERTELKYLEKDHLRQYEELSLSFRNLEITATEAHNRLIDQFTVEKEEWNSAKNNYENTIASSKKKLNEVMNQIDEKDIEIRDIRIHLQKNDETIHELNCTIDNYKSQFSSLQEDLKKKHNLLKESREQVSASEEKCSDLEKKLTVIEKELHTVKCHEEQLQTELEIFQQQYKTETDLLKNTIEKNNNDLMEEKERVSLLQKNLEKSENIIEEMKSARDILIMERSDLENKEAAVQQQRNDLKFAIEKEQERISELESTIEKLQMELSSKQEECLGYETTVESLKSDIETLEDDGKESEKAARKLQEELKKKLEVIVKMENTIDQKNQNESRLSSEINCIKEVSLSVRKEFEAVSEDIETKLKYIESLKKELKDEKSETSKLQKELKKAEKREVSLHSDLEKVKKEEETLRKEIEKLQRQIQEQQNLIDDLSKEKADLDQEMHNELESKVEAQSELETKMKSLKDDLSTKMKLTKDLEKEIRVLKKDLTTQSKLTTTKEREINKLKNDLDHLKLQNEALEKQEEESRNMVEQYKKTAEDSEKQAMQMNEKCIEAVKNKEEAVHKCDHQMAEMMATLEKYQQENHKIVTQKDKEIEQLKLKFETETSSNKKENKKMLDLENEVIELQTQIQTLGKENVSIKKKENDYQSRMNEMIKMQQLKESEIQELQILVDNLKSKEGSTIGVQTSPVIKNGEGSISSMSTPKGQSASMLSSSNKTVKEVAPMTPKRQLSLENLDLSSPSAQIKTPKTNYSLTNVITKTPQGPCRTPSADMKTPQRSILRQNSSCNSSIKKRRVAFMSESKQFNSDSDSDSSTSELMEVEMNQEGGCKGKKKNEKKTLYVRPSPKAKTPDTMEFSVDDEKEYKPKGRMSLNPVPRGPSLKNKMEKKQVERASWEEENLKQYNELYPEQSSMANKRDTTLNTVPKTSNIRKTPSKNQGKFFKTSPKDRPFKSKLNKKEELNWFDMDSVFGFGPED